MRLRSKTSSRAFLVIGAATSVALLTGSMAYAAVTNTGTSSSLAAALVATPTTLTGSSLAVNYPCTVTECPTAVSTTPLAGFPTSGASYTIMTTGNAALAEQPNTATNSGKDWGVDGTTALGAGTHDYQVLRVDLGPATGTCLAFDFRFLSEEYPEYVNAGYNDAFVAQLDTFAVHADPATQTVSAPGNFAAGAGDVISVDGAGPSAMFDTATTGVGTTYDGATPLLVARTPVAAGSSHTVYFTLFDQGDGILDSAVFLDNLRYESLPAGQCKSLALDPYEGQTGIGLTPGSSPSLTSTAINLPLTCNLPPGPVSCNENAVASFLPTGRTAARGQERGLKPVTIASGSGTFAPDTSGTLVMPLTSAGKGALTKAAKAPAKLKKQAKKLLKAAKKAKDPKKAKKLKAKAKKLLKKAKKLSKAPLGTVTVTVVNPANNAQSTFTFSPKR